MCYECTHEIVDTADGTLYMSVSTPADRAGLLGACRADVRLARDPSDFLSAPVGRCVVGPAFVVWCASPDLVGVIQWGMLDEPGLRNVVELVERVRHPELRPAGRLLVDFREITNVSGEVLLAFASIARERLSSWSRRIVRQAVVIPGGVTGILLAGALPSATPTYPLRYVHDLDDAVAFLGQPSAREPHLAAATIASAARERSSTIARLRALLARDLVDVTVERCAKLLRVSVRTLQRELRSEQTSFRDELRRARIAMAVQMLQTTDAKIDAIAERVGLGNGSRLSAVLRRELDLTPSAVRARVRKESQ